MIEIKETEINKMTKLQNYMRGYQDAKADMLSAIEDIKTEIMKEVELYKKYWDMDEAHALEKALEIIDKHISRKEYG